MKKILILVAFFTACTVGATQNTKCCVIEFDNTARIIAGESSTPALSFKIIYPGEVYSIYSLECTGVTGDSPSNPYGNGLEITFNISFIRDDGTEKIEQLIYHSKNGWE